MLILQCQILGSVKLAWKFKVQNLVFRQKKFNMKKFNKYIHVHVELHISMK
ncbi:MAG: hypothetical protein LBT10_07870 [Methanobrevibacter sp.]|nr:hypothetical protein [Methanobrevibacter sp.]